MLLKMSNFNDSKSNLTQTLLVLDRDAPMKAFLFVTPCVIFLYVNGVMLFTLRKKTVFQEKSRYILFGHMLWVDTLYLFMSVVLYICAVSRILIMKNVCLVLLIAAQALFQVSTINLALIHVEITSYRRTHIAIGVVWTMGLIQCLSEMIIFYAIDSRYIIVFSMFLRRYPLQIYKKIDIAFTCIFFVSVCFVIIFTYASIAAVAKTAACDKMSAKKANKTVLLHLIQLGLLFIIFPKCLSPLIYGLRDQAFSLFI
uniref:G-protein coupled receptors family 1 profile domain-containing protein n=1 Tax=Sinocyclocheilus rhinocerous TaxID=307959 RepID=A0A673J2W8_9TELE